MSARCFQTAVIYCALSYSLGAYYTENEWEVTNFRSVTEFEGLEQYYRKLRTHITDPENFTPIEPKDAKSRAHIWKTICNNVMSSPFFVMHDLKWSDPDVPSVCDKLRNNYRRLYDMLCRAGADSSTSARRLLPYEGGYDTMKTAYEDDDSRPLDEHIFVCLAQHIHNDSFVEYYISRDYNVNAVSENTFPIVGRFVFTTDNEHRLKVEALAEETSLEAEFFRRIHMIEPYYLAKRWRPSSSPTKDPSDDPICRLTEPEMLRMCASFFGASPFERKGLVFKPLMKNVVSECKKRRIHISTPIFGHGIVTLARVLINPHRSYEEWTISCTGTPISNVDDPTTFYVSWGNAQNSVFGFTYSEETRQLTTYGFFNNVSVVGDRNMSQGPLESQPSEIKQVLDFEMMDDPSERVVESVVDAMAM